MATPYTLEQLRIQPVRAARRDLGIGVVGAGFIVRDCHLTAYADAGFRVVGITSKSGQSAAEVARLRGVPNVYDSVEALLDDPDVEVLDIAVPPQDQLEVVRRSLSHPRPQRLRGILAQKPLAMSLNEARTLVDLCREHSVTLQVNQNMRYDHSVRALKALLDDDALGEVVLATIEMRAIPHWMPWAEPCAETSLSTFIMSIHHIDTLRYWLGDPARVLASSRPDPRTSFPHTDGINLYIFEYESGARASAWDDVWAGPCREGSASEIGIRWRVEGTHGMAYGTIGWPGWPERVPSTINYTTCDLGTTWESPRWPVAWFPDAFSGPMEDLFHAIQNGHEPTVSGLDNLKTLALCEAVVEAAHDHRVVDFKNNIRDL